MRRQVKGGALMKLTIFVAAVAITALLLTIGAKVDSNLGNIWFEQNLRGELAREITDTDLS